MSSVATSEHDPKAHVWRGDWDVGPDGRVTWVGDRLRPYFYYSKIRGGRWRLTRVVQGLIMLHRAGTYTWFYNTHRACLRMGMTWEVACFNAMVKLLEKFPDFPRPEFVIMSDHADAYPGCAGFGSNFPRDDAVRLRRARVEVGSDMEWVYENLWLDGVEPSDAPSVGAWGFLQHLRRDSKSANDFYLMMMRRGLEELKSRSEADAEGASWEGQGRAEALMSGDFTAEEPD